MRLSRTQLKVQSMRLVLKEMHNSILYRAQHRNSRHGVLSFVQEIRMLDLEQVFDVFFVLLDGLLAGEGAFD